MPLVWILVGAGAVTVLSDKARNSALIVAGVYLGYKVITRK